METREETEAREKKLFEDTKKFTQGALRKVGINITNPLAGLDVLGEPEYDEVNRKENWAGPEIENISKDVLSQIAIQKIPQKSLVPKLPPRSDGGRLINVTPKSGSEIIDQTNNLSRFKATTSDQKISEYEAAKLAARFMSARKTAGAENITLKGDGGFSERLGKKIVQQKQQQPNIFTNPKTGYALPGMAGYKASMDNEIEAFAMDLFSKGKTGYKSLGSFRSKIVNRLDPYQKLELYKTLGEGTNLQNGYIEHMIQKSPAMNWYWEMKNEDRDGLQNVRIAFDNRLKVLKDIVEGIVHGRKTRKGFKKGLGWQTDNLENRLIVSFEDPDKRSFIFNKVGLGNIVIRRAGNNNLVGKLGQYLASLYPQDQNIAAQLDSDVRNYIRSNKVTITVKTASGKDKVRAPTVAEWKRKFLENRINIIIKDSHKLAGMSESERNTFIGNAINEDMVQLREEFPWLPQEQTDPLTEVMADPDLSEEGYLQRGQKDKHIIPQLGGPFPSKTDTLNIQKAKRKGYAQTDLLDFLNNILPDRD